MTELLLVYSCPNDSYERGDIIAVRPEGFAWGREEILNKFIVIRIAGEQADLLFLQDPLMSDEAEPRIVERRRYKFDIANNLTEQQIADIQKSEDWIFPSFDNLDGIIDKTVG